MTTNDSMTIYDIIIIGSGPAGLTAGLYTARANLKTLIIAGSKWGGQLMLTTVVENFPGFPQGIVGPELMQLMRQQVERFGVKVVEEDVTGVDFARRPFGVDSYQGRAVIIATGAVTRWLNVPGEEGLIGRGVSSCAPCDAPFFKDKRVIVVGGGDAAMEEALMLAKYAQEVTIVHRRDAFRASRIMQDRVLANPAIKVRWNTEVGEILGKQKVAGVRFTGGEQMAVDGVFVAIGHTPASQIFAGKIELDEQYYAKRLGDLPAGRQGKYKTMSNIQGVFVAGDVHDYHYRQAVTAAGYGCEAALDATRWLGEQHG